MPHDLLALVHRHPIIRQPRAVGVPQVVKTQPAELVAGYADGDGAARDGVGGGVDHRYRVRVGVGDVGAEAVRGDRHTDRGGTVTPFGVMPTGMGLPATVLVVVSITDTVFELVLVM